MPPPHFPWRVNSSNHGLRVKQSSFKALHSRISAHGWPLGLLLFVDSLSPHLCISTHEWTHVVYGISCILPPLLRISTHEWSLGLLLFVDSLSPHSCISTYEWTHVVYGISCILPPLLRISTHEWLCSRCAYTYFLRIGGGQIKGSADASLSIKYT